MRRRFMSLLGFNETFDINNYLTIEALEDGFTCSFPKNLEYGIDGQGWKSLKGGTTSPPINIGQTISFRGNLTLDSSNGIGTFKITKSCNLKGNCMSLLFGDDADNNLNLSGKDYAFYNLFKNCTTIKSISTRFLPATTLSVGCYYYMFNGCTSLTQAPELPATTLANYCYYNMFYKCTSLTTAPSILPATTLAYYCYGSMFSECTSLINAPELPATTLAESCYNNMFNYCGSLTQAPELPATMLADYCYDSMFYGTNVLPDCSNINFSSESVVSSRGLRRLFAGTKVTDADLERILPKNSNGKYCLPVTTLSDNCYYGMFQRCSYLTTTPELPATTLANYCYGYMFDGCTSLTQAPELPATTLVDYCYDNMFSGCSSLTTAPELPAINLASACYRSMFRFCTSLITAPELPATNLANSCYYKMFDNCDSLTTAPELPATRLTLSCYSYMFYGCSKLNYIKAMFTTTPSDSYTANWVLSIASTGTFVKNKNATWNVTGEDGIPVGWTVQTA